MQFYRKQMISAWARRLATAGAACFAMFAGSLSGAAEAERAVRAGESEWLLPALLIVFLGGAVAVLFLRVQVRKKTKHLRLEIEQKEQTERRLRESETRYRSLVEQAGDAILLSEHSTGRFVEVNDRACEMYGYSHDEFLSLFGFHIYPSFSKEKRDELIAAMDADVFASVEGIHRRKDGSTFPVEVRARVIELDSRKLILALARDLTDRKRVEEALLKSEDRTRKIIENSAAGYFRIDREGCFTEVNDAWLRMHRYSSARDVIGQHFSITQVDTDLEDAQKNVAELMDGAAITEGEFSRRCRDGAVEYHSFSANPVFSDGKVVGLEGFIVDNTKRMRAEEKLKAAIRIANLGYWIWYADTNVLDCSEEFNRLLGLEDETIEIATENFVRLIHPDDQERVGKAIEKTITELAPYEIEYRVIRPVDGKTVWIYTVAEHVFGADGALFGVSGTAQDITERKHMEDQLRLAQKMEAVGKLTSGVAHEFNNILQAILGNLQLLSDHIGDDGEAAKMVDNAVAASMRGGKLNQQLLSFSQKQVLFTKAVDINESLSGISGLLEGTLGENISLKTVFAKDLVSVDLDPGSFEGAILHLALNARSAMPDGGTLTIETANTNLEKPIPHDDGELPVGRYVVVTVSDTGCGMVPEVLERAFEPFFTTRDVGQGTGLGLSAVYGFTRQSGGHSTIESEPGKGTRVTMYLPVAT